MCGGLVPYHEEMCGKKIHWAQPSKVYGPTTPGFITHNTQNTRTYAHAHTHTTLHIKFALKEKVKKKKIYI